jgi:hypothetical protein
MKRTIQILSGLLVVQIVLAVVVLWPRSAATAGSEPLYGDMESNDIVALTITDDKGETIELKKVTGKWVLPQADDYPAKEDKVTPVTEALAALTTNRLVTRTEASHKRLQVSPDDFVRKITFQTAEGEDEVLYLGSSPSYGATHFREDGQDEVYLASDLSVWDLTAAITGWAVTSYPSATSADVTHMTVKNDQAELSFTKDEAGNWSLDDLAADETVDAGKITAVLNRATAVNINRPLGTEELPAYGMDTPSAVVTLEAGEKTVTLTIGAQDPDDKTYVLKSSESPFYVRVSEFTVINMVEQGRDHYLQLPPTPTPEPATETSSSGS